MGKGRAVHRQGKPQGRRAISASDKCQRNIARFFERDVTLAAARITANRGSYFALGFFDGKRYSEEVLQGSPCGTFLSGGKVRLRMAVNDIVLVEGFQRAQDAQAAGKKLTVEIVGKLSKKLAQMAYRSDLIRQDVYGRSEEDDLFDYGDGDSEDEEEEDSDEEVAVTKKRGVARAKKVTGAAGRGSGGKTGAGGAAKPTARETVREHLDATAAADLVARRERAADYEPSDEELLADAEGLGVKPEKKAAAPAEAAGGAGPARPATQFGLYDDAPEEEPEVSRHELHKILGPTKDRWDDEDELDIDNI
jgi:hypothetical protein